MVAGNDPEPGPPGIAYNAASDHSPGFSRLKLLIAIPALDEEDAIADIITRCLDAREEIIAGTAVDAVDITVVSDGSTDRTVEIARGFADRIRLIVFERNRGYGAAIQEAWRQSDAELLSFLDADGTCDPRFFRQLVNAITDDNADIALGCRMTAESEMPLVRTIGNRLFSLLLSAFSSEKVRDTASGMRVVRRDSLHRILPLPPGLNFTPAMSARAVLADNLHIVERDMTYRERVGDSKLNPVKDGYRFLMVILKTALVYRPSRVLGIAGIVCALLAVLLMISPLKNYLAEQVVAEWMIYRFIVAELLGIAAVTLFSFGYLGTASSALLIGNEPSRGLTRHLFRPWILYPGILLLLLAGLLVIRGSFMDYLTTGQVFDHWSRFIVSSFFIICALILSATGLLHYILSLVNERRRYLESESSAQS